jgi:hypothetical protein
LEVRLMARVYFTLWISLSTKEDLKIIIRMASERNIRLQELITKVGSKKGLNRVLASSSGTKIYQVGILS